MSGHNALEGMYCLRSVQMKEAGINRGFTGFGENPSGFIAFSREKMSAVLTADSKLRDPRSHEKPAMFDTAIAYGGSYSFDGERLSTLVETAWSQEWVGTRQERFVEWEDGLLVLSAIGISVPWDPEVRVDAYLRWEKLP